MFIEVFYITVTLTLGVGASLLADCEWRRTRPAARLRKRDSSKTPLTLRPPPASHALLRCAHAACSLRAQVVL